MIHTDKLTRHFVSRSETVEAVKGVDIDVQPGELVAFLGPNGAGKSTTLRMLTTLLPPTAGTATVAGVSITDDPAGVRARIGYIGQGNGAGHSFRVLDELISQGRFYGLDRTTIRQRVGELLETLDLTGLEKRRVSTLSGGQRRRLDIALGLLHRPGLLFLDEPSTGMDPHNRANLWDHIARLRETYQTTIVLTTHYLEEADTQSERVIVIDHGVIIADDTATTLKARLAGDRITLTVDPDSVQRAAAVMAEHGSQVAHEPSPAGPDGVGGPDGIGAAVVSARFDHGTRALPRLLRTLDGQGVEVLAADVTVPTLDDVFLALTGRSLREEGRPDPASPDDRPDQERADQEGKVAA